MQVPPQEGGDLGLSRIVFQQLAVPRRELGTTTSQNSSLLLENSRSAPYNTHHEDRLVVWSSERNTRTDDDGGFQEPNFKNHLQIL